MLFGTSCFEFVARDDAVSYDEASAYCQSAKKQLAIIHDDNEQQFVANTIEARGWDNAMIGLRYRQSAWKWIVDGSMVRGQGCYDNDVTKMVEKNQTSVASLTIDACFAYCKSNHRPYAGVQAGSLCYCTSSYSWTSAASNCSMPCAGNSSQLCGNLFISYGYYTGDDSYDNWLPGRPTSGYGCAAMTAKPGRNWADYACSSQLAFMCQYPLWRNVSSSNAAKFGCYRSMCYFLYTDQALNFTESDDFCQRRGGRLVKIGSRDVQDVINSLLMITGSNNNNNNFTTPIIDRFWIGANNRQFAWPDNTSTLDFNYQAWAQDSLPTSPPSSNQECVELNGLEPSYWWTARPCDPVSGANTFVCSYDAIGVTRTTVPPTTTPDIRPWFRISTNQQMTNSTSSTFTSLPPSQLTKTIMVDAAVAPSMIIDIESQVAEMNFVLDDGNDDDEDLVRVSGISENYLFQEGSGDYFELDDVTPSKPKISAVKKNAKAAARNLTTIKKVTMMKVFSSSSSKKIETKSTKRPPIVVKKTNKITTMSPPLTTSTPHRGVGSSSTSGRSSSSARSTATITSSSSSTTITSTVSTMTSTTTQPRTTHPRKTAPTKTPPTKKPTKKTYPPKPTTTTTPPPTTTTTTARTTTKAVTTTTTTAPTTTAQMTTRISTTKLPATTTATTAMPTTTTANMTTTVPTSTTTLKGNAGAIKNVTSMPGNNQTVAALTALTPLNSSSSTSSLLSSSSLRTGAAGNVTTSTVSSFYQIKSATGTNKSEDSEALNATLLIPYNPSQYVEPMAVRSEVSSSNEIQWWGILLIVLACLAFLVAISVLILYLVKKRVINMNFLTRTSPTNRSGKQPPSTVNSARVGAEGSSSGGQNIGGEEALVAGEYTDGYGGTAAQRVYRAPSRSKVAPAPPLDFLVVDPEVANNNTNTTNTTINSATNSNNGDPVYLNSPEKPQQSPPQPPSTPPFTSFTPFGFNDGQPASELPPSGLQQQTENIINNNKYRSSHSVALEF